MRNRLGSLVGRLRSGGSRLVARIGRTARRVGGAVRRAVGRAMGRSSGS